MKQKIRRTIALFSATLLILCSFTGCSKLNRLIGADDSVPVAFEEDTVFTVDDRQISIAEWELYASSQESRINSMYGTGIWNIRINDELGTISDSIKRDIYEQIVYVKIVAAAAEKLGVTLTEDDELDIDYLADEYLGELNGSGKTIHGVSKKLVSDVYRDNLLAQRVEEKIMLGVNTDIEESTVRHMVLDYLVVMKTYEDENGDIAAYTDEELAVISEGIEEYYEEVRREIFGLPDEGQDADGQPDADAEGAEPGEDTALPAAEAEMVAVKNLSELHTEQYVPTTFVADYNDLHDRLPYAIADTAYAMKQGELLGVIETEEAYYILFCESEEDIQATNAARVEVIERRQKELFEEKYRTWEKQAVIRMNYDVWDSLEVR